MMTDMMKGVPAPRRESTMMTNEESPLLAPERTEDTPASVPSSARNVHPETVTIAERIRAARLAAHKTQQELAGNLYSKSYISAIERAKMTPSVQALGVLAERLGVSVAYLIGEGEMDLEVLAKRRARQRSTPERERAEREEAALLTMSKAEALIRQDRPREALEQLGTGDGPPEDVPVGQRPIWYWLAGWASTLEGRSAEAIRLLERGLRLAEHLHIQAPLDQQPSLAEVAERLRCFLGVAYCARGQTELALGYHRRGLTAIEENIVTDPELKLLIYKGLATEDLALGNYQDAISFYQQSAKQADDLDNARQQGLTYWGLGVAYQESGDLGRAKENYQQALTAFGILGNLQLVAQVRALFGQLLTRLAHYEEAEQHLRKSLEGAERLGDSRIAGIAWGNLAALYLAKGEPEQAIQAATQGLQLAQPSEDHRSLGQLQLTLAAAYEARHDAAATEQALKEAIQAVEQTQDRDILGQAYERYGQFLAEQGRFQDAYAQMSQARAAITKR